MIDPEEIQDVLRMLHRYALNIPNYYADQVASFLLAGEYYLSMDTIADAFLKNKVEMPSYLFLQFEDLAIKLGLDRHPEYEAVAELISRQVGNRSQSSTLSDHQE